MASMNTTQLLVLKKSCNMMRSMSLAGKKGAYGIWVLYLPAARGSRLPWSRFVALGHATDDVVDSQQQCGALHRGLDGLRLHLEGLPHPQVLHVHQGAWATTGFIAWSHSGCHVQRLQTASMQGEGMA